MSTARSKRRSSSANPRVTVLAGGVGAARLLRGLQMLARGASLRIIVNTSDDDVFYGLHVSPDIDTVLYALSGLGDPVRGWGVLGDTFSTLAALERYRGRSWFQVGDRDLATHLFRTERLAQGDSLSTVTAAQARALRVRAHVLPMTDAAVRTKIDTAQGRRTFQEYLVRDRARETVRAIHYSGARSARPAPGVLAAIESADLLVVAPSNPLVSIGPILATPGIRAALRRATAPVVAVCPLIAGKPVKGPADRMLRALGIPANPLGIADRYRDFLDGMVIDRADEAFVPELAARGLSVDHLDTLMHSPKRSLEVARAVLALGRTLTTRRRLAV